MRLADGPPPASPRLSRKAATVRGCLILLWLGLALPWTSLVHAAGDVPAYDNDDLRRVSPRRGETGVASEPAVPPTASREAAPAGAHGEDFWRGEAEKLREQLARLRQQAAALRLRIESAASREAARKRREPGASGGVETLRQRLRLIEEDMREREARFEERARRERALPGWLR